MRTHVLTVYLLFSGVSTFVPDPTDVAVDCQNIKVLAKWNYNDEQHQTIFSVVPRFDGLPSEDCTKNTTAHQVDLSDCFWTSEEGYTKILYVTVTAVLGGNRSDDVKSNTLSFNSLKTVTTLCSLDFPPVDVNEDDSKFTVNFHNPLVFYKKQFPVRNLDLKFTVVPVENVSSQYEEDYMEVKCTAKDDICKHDVRLPEGVVTCFAITGTLVNPTMENNPLKLNETKACPSHSTVKEVWISAVVIMSITACVIAVAVFFVCKTRAWTMQSPDLPKSLRVENVCVMTYEVSPRELIHKAVVQRPKRAAWSDGTSDSGNNVKGSKCSLHTSEQCLYAEREQQELLCEENAEQNSSNSSVTTDSTSLESEEEQREFLSNYDAPHMLVMDMGDGDHAIAYTEN